MTSLKPTSVVYLGSRASRCLRPITNLCANNVEPIITSNMSAGELKELLNVGLKQSYRKVVEEHRRNNQPLIFSENGQVQYVDPFTVNI